MSDKEEEQKMSKQEEGLMKMAKSQNECYLFSPTLKRNGISIQNKKTAAKCGYDGKCGFVVVDGRVFERESCMKLVIESIGDGIGVGMCLKNVLVKNGFDRINSYKIEHGVFMIFSEGYSFNHSKKNQTKIETDFRILQKDVIEVVTNGCELKVVNLINKKVHKITVKLTQEEWNYQARFCVWLFDGSSCRIVH